jgi:hypothetical protein
VKQTSFNKTFLKKIGPPAVPTYPAVWSRITHWTVTPKTRAGITAATENRVGRLPDDRGYE